VTFKDPFVEFEKFRKDLMEVLGLKEENDVRDELSYPLGGEARVLLDKDGKKIARLELHGAFEDPYHVDIHSSRKTVLEAARNILKAIPYGFGNVYIWDDNDPGNYRQKIE